MTITPIMAIGGAAALGVGAYAISKVSADKAKGVDCALADSGKTITGMSADSVSNVVMDGATEEYNMARERYRMVAGAYPPRSWTIEMINMWIEEQSKKEDLIKQYVALVSENSAYVQRENTAELTYQQIDALIAKTQNAITSGKQKEAKVKEYKSLVSANSKYTTEVSTASMSAEQVDALIIKTKNEIAANKEKERVKILADRALALAKAFRATLQAPNYYNGTLKNQNAWDTATLNAMINLSKEGKEYCEYYCEQAGPIKLPGYFNQTGSAWKSYVTISSCIINSNTNTWRKGASTATALKSAFNGISAVKPIVGADGSLVMKRPASTNPIIAFHLSQL